MKKNILIVLAIATWSSATAQKLHHDSQGRLYLEPEQPTQAVLHTKYPANFQSSHPSLQHSGLIYGGTPWSGLNYQIGSGVLSAGDINGDGKGDLIQRVLNVPDISTSDLEDIIPFLTLVFLGDLSAPSQTFTDIANIFPVGDIDGDGFGDAIVQSFPVVGTSYQFYFGSPTGYVSSMHGFTLPSAITTASVVSSGDYNGDGLADVLINVGNVLHLISGHTDRASIQMTTRTIPDGIAEVQSFRRSDNDNDYFAFLQNGNSVSIAALEEDTLVNVQTLNQSATVAWWALADLNADDEPDLVVGTINGVLQWFPGLSPAEASSEETLFGPAVQITKDAAINVNSVRPYSDITGDGSDDFILSLTTGIDIANGADVIVNGIVP